MSIPHGKRKAGRWRWMEVLGDIGAALRAGQAVVVPDASGEVLWV